MSKNEPEQPADILWDKESLKVALLPTIFYSDGGIDIKNFPNFEAEEQQKAIAYLAGNEAFMTNFAITLKKELRNTPPKAFYGNKGFEKASADIDKGKQALEDPERFINEYDAKTTEKEKFQYAKQFLEKHIHEHTALKHSIDSATTIPNDIIQVATEKLTEAIFGDKNSEKHEQFTKNLKARERQTLKNITKILHAELDKLDKLDKPKGFYQFPNSVEEFRADRKDKYKEYHIQEVANVIKDLEQHFKPDENLSKKSYFDQQIKPKLIKAANKQSSKEKVKSWGSRIAEKMHRKSESRSR